MKKLAAPLALFATPLSLRIGTLIAAPFDGLYGQDAYEYLPPFATDGQTCITIITLGRNPRQLRSPILGPCSWYAAFGQPGRSVEAWFVSRGYAFAMGGAPDLSTDPSDTSLSQREPERVRWIPHYGWPRWQTDYGPRLLCAAGRLTTCRNEILSTRDSVGAWHMSRHLWTPWNLNRSQLGTLQRYLLADLFNEIGERRFRSFWKSDRQVEEAFATAAGVSLGEWTSGWAQRRYGTPELGARLASSAQVLAFLSMIALTAVASLWCTRRQVG